MLPGMRVGAVPARSYYATDFREYATGVSLPTPDWTINAAGTAVPEANTASFSGRAVRVSCTSAGVLNSNRWILAGSRDDLDLVGRFKIEAFGAGAGDAAAVLLARRQASADAYTLRLRADSSGALHLTIFKSISGVSTVLATTAFTFDTTNRWWMRFNLSGSTLSGRAWQDGTAEPTTWTVSATNSDITAAGEPGFTSSNEVADVYLIDWLAIGFGSAKAPLPAG